MIFDDIDLQFSLMIAFDPDDLFLEHANDARPNDLSDDDSEDMSRGWNHQPVHYVYDAAAERTKARIAAAHLNSQTVVPGIVNG